MNTAELIYQHAKRLPEFQAREVLDFMEFLAHRRPVQTQPAAHWQKHLRKTAGIQWNGRKPIGGGTECPCLDNQAKTVSERVLEDRV